MLLFQATVGPFEANCYIAGDNETREAIVIDPGGDAARILDIIEQHKLRISTILNTHGHIDHIAANLAVVVGRLTIRVLHTPGHTRGSICLLMNDVIFTGDTLFKESVGRCDLPGGDAPELQHSLRTKILPLSDTYVVYPGHGDTTNLEHERQRNPFLCEL